MNNTDNDPEVSCDFDMKRSFLQRRSQNLDGRLSIISRPKCKRTSQRPFFPFFGGRSAPADDDDVAC